MAKRNITCPVCGRSFTPWRQKKFCSERCRKTDESRRARGGMEGRSATTLAGVRNSEKNTEKNQEFANAARGDEPALGEGSWIACNEVTRKFCRTPQSEAMGWVMRVESGKWIACVRDTRGDWRLGPSTERRAMVAAEAWIRHEPFEKQESERMWAGEYYLRPW